MTRFVIRKIANTISCYINTSISLSFFIRLVNIGFVQDKNIYMI
nr:MAG TPA: hypothetical protein [Caudoviricetes sp.]